MNTTDNNYDDLRQRLTEIFSQDINSLAQGCGCGSGCGCHSDFEDEMEPCNCDSTDQGCNCKN